MKRKIALAVSMIIGISFMISSCSVSPESSKKVKLTNDLDSVSYAIGVDIGGHLKRNGFETINPDAVVKGFEDAFSNEGYIIEPELAGQYVMEYLNKTREKEAENNLIESEEFLAKNAKKSGVMTTESGLQYKVIEEGSGEIPKMEDRVSVYYRGTLIDGTEFDATQPENPARFPVTGVIKGWTEALMMMPVGSKWELYIHPDLAYGNQPRQGGPIQPNNALIFEIELLEINPK